MDTAEIQQEGSSQGTSGGGFDSERAVTVTSERLAILVAALDE